MMALFERLDVVAGPVLDIRDIVNDPHYLARQDIIAVEDDDFGSVRMQGVVPKFSDTPGAVRHAGRALGADNRAIYVESMGMSEEKFAGLQASGVI